MDKPLSDFDINAILTYSGSNGYWKPLQVWTMLETDYKKLCILSNVMSDEKWNKRYKGSWWRGCKGSNMGFPNFEFVIKGQKIDAWLNEYRLNDLATEYENLCDEERSEYKNQLDYIFTWTNTEYKNILEYLCNELGASTETNVAVLVSDLAKWNEVSVADLFKKYGES